MRRRVRNTLILAAIISGVVVLGLPQPLMNILLNNDLLLGETGKDDLRAAEPLPRERPTVARTYTQTKRWLFEEVFAGHHETLYCACRFDDAKRADLASCGYVAAGNPERAARVEVEHVVPASWLGQGRPCWRQRLCTNRSGRRFKGRECCARIDPDFRAAYNDLHNLWPAIGEINEQRRHYRFDELPGEPRDFGQCDFEVDDETHRAEPRPAVRGDIARIHLYMEMVHGVRLSAALRARLMTWDRADPPDAWERERDARIERLQGNRNPFLERRRLADLETQ